MKHWASASVKQVLVDASAGLLSGVMRVLGAVSIATLLFPGRLSEFFLTGVSIGVVTVVAANLVGGIRNKIPYVTYSTDYPPIFLFSVVAATLFSELPASQFLATLVLFIAASSIATGLVFFLVGHFKLSNLARFVPYPVVAGFMAGIGLLIVIQSLGSLARVSLTWDSAPRLLDRDAILHWTPGVAFALFMMFGGRIIRTKFFPQIAIGLAIGIFLTILALTDTPIAVAHANGWSAAPVQGNLPFQFYVASIWNTAAPKTLLAHAYLDIFVTIIGVSLLSVLITLTGLELSAKQEMKFERELKDAGLANIASGLLGGAISFQSVSASTMNHRLGGRSRLVPILTGLVALVFLAFGWGAVAIQYLPIALLSGLVLYVGLDFVHSWLFDSRKRMTAVEHCLLVAIACTIVVWGVITGVLLGIAVAMLLFTITYTRLRCIYLRQTGQSLRSKVERPAMQEEVLARHDDQLRLFRLQGYLFFGSAETVGETVKREIKGHRPVPDVPLTVILDFQSVVGIDSSATMAFAKIFDAARARGASIMLIHLSSGIEAILRRSLGPEVMAGVRVFAGQDAALEVRENFILDLHRSDAPPHNASDALSESGIDAADIKDVMSYFERQNVAAAEVVFRQGEKAESMLIVDSGEFEIYLDTPDGNGIRLRKVVAGSILGEMGIYLLGAQRTASVRATTDGCILVLDKEALTRMHAERPALALKFNRFIIGVLAGRLAHSNDEILELSGAHLTA
ncbi:MAG: SulP family inorganic anion transporter [Usitatibacter sp.]